MHNIVFTDEKNFTLEIPLNKKNDVVYGTKKCEIAPSRLYHEQNSFSQKIMVSAGVSFNGKTRIYFLDMSTKVDSEAYVKLLNDCLLPDCSELYPNNEYTFMQNGANSHRSRYTTTYLEDKNIDFIKKDDWPPKSPDLNPMDFTIWNQLRDAVYKDRTEPYTVNELRDRIQESWDALPIERVRSAIAAWKGRLRDVIAADGGSIEHLRL